MEIILLAYKDKVKKGMNKTQCTKIHITLCFNLWTLNARNGVCGCWWRMILILFHKASALRHLGFYFFFPWRICIHSCMHLLISQHFLKCVGVLASNNSLVNNSSTTGSFSLVCFSCSFTFSHIYKQRWRCSRYYHWNSSHFPTTPSPDVCKEKVWTVRWEPKRCLPSRNKSSKSLTHHCGQMVGLTLMFYLRQRHLVARRYGYPLFCQLPMISLKARVTKHPCSPVTEWVYACCPDVIINGPWFPCRKC